MTGSRCTFRDALSLRRLAPAPLPLAVADEPALLLFVIRRRARVSGWTLPHLTAFPPHLAHPLPQRADLRIIRVVHHQPPFR